MPGRQVIIITGILLALFATSIARAQDIVDGLRLTRKHLEAHAAALDFTPAQQQVAETKFAAYEREFNDAHVAYEAMINWLWTATDLKSWYGGESTEPFTRIVSRKGRLADEAWHLAARRLETEWFDALGRIAVGREAQVESLRFARLRERMFSTQGYSWEPDGVQTDLIAIVGSVDALLIDQPAIRVLLDDYERRLDELLRAYDEWNITFRMRLYAAREAMLAAREAGEDATAKRDAAVDIFVEWYRHMLNIWRLQQQSAAALLAATPDDRRAALDDAIFETLHHYLKSEKGQTPGEAFAAAFDRKSLSPNQREQLLALRDRWRARRTAALPNLTQAYLRVVDPEVIRARYAAVFDHVRVADVAREEWLAKRAEWLVESDAMIASINAVLAETADEVKP